ncbi:MAG: proline--tRNA ligase [Nitrospirae bacterium YQR-1]
MKYSKLLIPTLKETPSEAEAVSHVLMLRGGYVRQLAAGLYLYMPLFLRVMNKINKIIREEMDAIGAQEVSMPVLHPAEVWQKTGRWYDIKDEMFRLKDRTGRDMCLAMTHEEIMTWLASREIRSYRELPQMWYQIQTKLRDEARPKSGILRTREFIMKDSYSFDAGTDGLNISYELHAEAYKRIYTRCGLKFYMVESDPGMMGGATAHEFMAPSPAGEDDVALCSSCGYAANVELAVTTSRAIEFDETPFEEVFTPGKRTIDEVAGFLERDSQDFIKTLVLISDSGPVLALIRGDQELHEKKTQRIIGNFRIARKDEIQDIAGVEAGFIGPVGHTIKMIADNVLGTGSYVSGANKKDYHIRGIKPGVHFSADYYDLHMAHNNDGCPACGKPIVIERVIEIGNIFKLGTKYSIALNAVFLDKDGVEKPIIMGSYGIGPARVAAAAIEQNHDEHGIIWPPSIAPFAVVILPLNVNDTVSQKAAEDIYNSLTTNYIEVLMDDRDERAGIKFKDADLIGIPLQVVIGPKGLKENVIEIKIRKSKESLRVSPDKVLETVQELLQKWVEK